MFLFLIAMQKEQSVSRMAQDHNYVIQTENGNYQRNRGQLRPLPQTELESETQSERPDTEQTESQQTSGSMLTHTKSGRISHPPIRYSDLCGTA